jgi:hypothetical protein
MVVAEVTATTATVMTVAATAGGGNNNQLALGVLKAGDGHEHDGG